MIQDKIQLKLHAQSTDTLQVLRRCQQFIQMVIDDRESPVKVGVENTGENIKRTESIFTAAFQQICNVT